MRPTCGATRTPLRVIGTNFGSVPYNNTVNGELVRIPFQPPELAASVSVSTATGRALISSSITRTTSWEPAATTNITVTNGAFVPRLRLFWVDVRKGDWEFLTGQSWSMLTPNRQGISAFPGDIFYSQVFDVNYMAGLTGPPAGHAVLYHPSKTVTWGFRLRIPIVHRRLLGRCRRLRCQRP